MGVIGVCMQCLHETFCNYVSFVYCMCMNYFKKYIFTIVICYVRLIVSATIQNPGPCGRWRKTDCDALPIPGINKFSSFSTHFPCLRLV